MALTTLILGAGLGREYGFPDGAELRQQIMGELSDDDLELREMLAWSTDETVDEFAARHPKHVDQIRRIVIKILRNCEIESNLQQNIKPNTYKLMLKQIAAAFTKGDKVRIITFNYDRSLQYLLHRVNAYEPSERQIDPSIIIPIYGRLAPLGFEDAGNRNRRINYHKYGAEIDTSQVFLDGMDLDGLVQENDRQADASIQDGKDFSELCRNSKIIFIGETGASKASEIDGLLEKSDRIYFLGVGYHRANMEVMGFDFKKPHPGRIVAGTGLNLSGDDIDSLKETYPAINLIEPCDAHTFLKRKFDISEPSKNMLKRSASSLDVL